MTVGAHDLRMDKTAYHWIITFQWPGGAVNSCDGISCPGPGVTRGQLYQGVRAQMAEATRQENSGLSGLEPIVVFFSLEPDDLSAGTGAVSIGEPVHAMADYLEEAAVPLRQAARDNARKFAEFGNLRMFDGERKAAERERMEIIAAFTRLAAIERGLLPPEMIPGGEGVSGEH